MTYRGHIKQGVIVLDPPIQLPEGAEVEVRTAEQGAGRANWADVVSPEDEALISGSVEAVSAVLPREDFSDWEN